MPVERRTVELHYGGFVVSQQRVGPDEARRLALDTPYGREPIDVQLPAGPGRGYELGPEVPPDDFDGREPAVVAWASGDRFYLVASTEIDLDVLFRVAGSVR